MSFYYRSLSQNYCGSKVYNRGKSDNLYDTFTLNKGVFKLLYCRPQATGIGLARLATTAGSIEVTPALSSSGQVILLKIVGL